MNEAHNTFAATVLPVYIMYTYIWAPIISGSCDLDSVGYRAIVEDSNDVTRSRSSRGRGVVCDLLIIVDCGLLLQEWARFTGKFVEGRDKPDFKMFKTRLRCAFNKAPDIEEVPEMRKYKGISPYRVYRLLKNGNPSFA